jgi:hypothetical protein
VWLVHNALCLVHIFVFFDTAANSMEDKEWHFRLSPPAMRKRFCRKRLRSSIDKRGFVKMNLPQKDADLFYKLMWGLQFFVNQQLKILRPSRLRVSG